MKMSGHGVIWGAVRRMAGCNEGRHKTLSQESRKCVATRQLDKYLYPPM
jgi:hypothetical protein